jgi:Zn-dependent M28 family amino/carboxypeptidase
MRMTGIRRRSGLCTAVFILAGVALAAPLATQTPASAPGNDSIRREEMMADMVFLTSDLLKGRYAGTSEDFLAAEFVRARFARLGLKPAAGTSYFQDFWMTAAKLGAENVLEIRLNANQCLRLKPGQDYYPQRFSANSRANGALVFCGFGVRAEDFGQAAKGRIVVILMHEPGEFDPESPFDGLVTSEAANPLRKTLLAQEKGAVGILFVEDKHNHAEDSSFQSSFERAWPADPMAGWGFLLSESVDKVRIPAAQISPALAETLFLGTQKTLLEFGKEAENTKAFVPIPVSGPTADLSVSIDRIPVRGRNVVGMLEGSDPVLRNEAIVICAHHDHNGVEDGVIMPGADDDISGVVATIDIAEAYVLAALSGQRARRTLIFASWDAEEQGLVGARHYVDHPFIPLEKTVAVLNMDLIGRNEEILATEDWRFRGLEVQTSESNANTINILGLTRFPRLRAPLERANGPFGLTLKTKIDNNASQLLRRSDHWPFMQRGVPALWFLTGIHPDYHTTYDRADRINGAKMELVARLVHEMSWLIAQEGL